VNLARPLSVIHVSQQSTRVSRIMSSVSMLNYRLSRDAISYVLGEQARYGT